jgi:hypothetical protein
MSAEANHTSPGVSRTELIRILADVSHQTWLRQMVRDHGSRPEDLDQSITCRDLERAEDVVAKLEELALIRFR